LQVFEKSQECFAKRRRNALFKTSITTVTIDLNNLSESVCVAAELITKQLVWIKKAKELFILKNKLLRNKSGHMEEQEKIVAAFDKRAKAMEEANELLLFRISTRSFCDMGKKF
jgi:phosphopantothenate synthetase